MVELAENVRTFLEDVHLGVIATISPSMSSTRSSFTRMPTSAMRW